MKKLFSGIFAAALLSQPLFAVQEKTGPDYVPPFESKQGGRQNAELTVTSFLDKENGNKPVESASLVVGNKRIAVREFKQKQMSTRRDNVLSVFVNENPVFEFIFAGSYRNAEKKWNSIVNSKPENTTIKTDKKAGTIRWSCRYELPDGKQTEFSYTLKSLGNSRIELAWDTGISEKQAADYRKQGNVIGGGILYLEFPADYRKNGVLINGKPIVPKPEAELRQNKNKKVALWSGSLKELVYNPAKPLERIAVKSGSPLIGSCSEIFHYGRIDLGFHLNFQNPQGNVTIDFGETSVKTKNQPPPVEGHDLWTQDALHIPQLPTANMFPNPSFEQGLRYWRWWSGGAAYSPSDVKRFGIDGKTALFGSKSLVINPVQHSSAPLRSFSLPARKGESYTISFYAKSEKNDAFVKLAPFSSKTGGKFTRDTVGKLKHEKIGPEWKRISHTFVSDGSPVCFILLANNNGGKIWIDGIQFERGTKATPFISAPLEGRLTTSDPDNNVEFGSKLNTGFEISGKKGIAGKAEFTLLNFYKKTLFEKQYSVKAGERIELPFDSLKLAPGIYVLKVKYTVPGTREYYDYYRFAVIRSLDGKQATKDLYGALFQTRIDRAEDLLRLQRRLGFGGSSSYGNGKLKDPVGYQLRRKYNITDYTHELIGGGGLHLTGKDFRKNPEYQFLMTIDSRIWRTPEERKTIKVLESYSPEVLAKLEKLAEKVAKEHPYVRVWSIATEEEGTIPCLAKRRDYKEFAKLQRAFYRGVKRGNPNALCLPSGGTSGYGKVRGKENIEGYLAATPDIKWDAIAIHPYGSCDGTLGSDDLDENLQMLSDSIAKFGYGKKTPIFLNEGGGGSAALWGDGPDYSYSGGQASYDIGLHEFLHASKMARLYTMCLKYWPRLPHFNSWQGDQAMIVDHNLTPNSFLLGINTLNHVLGNPRFVADIRPAPGMRGYAFKNEKGEGVAALWCTSDDVERGFQRGPVMRVKFDGKAPELIDLMGKAVPVKTDSEGVAEFQLTPAPFFLRGGDPVKLAETLKNAEIIGAGSSMTVSFKPSLSGKITADMKNLTGRMQTGKIIIDGKTADFKVAGNKTEQVEISGPEPEFGKMFRWIVDYSLLLKGGAPLTQQWKMDYFYVPRINGVPDWNKIPAIAIRNIYRPVRDMKQTPGGHPGDLSANFKLAWNSENLYLRVEAEDDIFNVNEPKFWNNPEARRNALYLLDGCLEVYFDCGANGRLRKGGYDLDDYRYDFCAGNPEGKSGRGLVCRLREVFMEYGGGVEFPTKEQAAKGIKCEFTRISKTKYAYTITFAQRYLEPLRLTRGTVAGFSLYLHDRLDDGTLGNKGLTLATEPGAHSDFNPHFWPLMILAD